LSFNIFKQNGRFSGLPGLLRLPKHQLALSGQRIQKTFLGLQLRVQLPTSSQNFIYIGRAQDSHFKDIPEKEYSTIQKPKVQY
jgi:hypothetical protein